MPKTKGLFELSSDTAVAIAFARQTDVGGVLERAAVAAKLGRDPKDPKLNNIMASVFRVLLRDEKINFDTIPKVGWRRMPHNEVAEKVSERARRSIHAKARKADNRIAAAMNSGQLSPEETTEASRARSLNRVLVEVTKPTTFRQLETKMASNGSSPVPTQKMLDYLKDVC